MKLIVVTPPDFFEDECNHINRMFEQGLPILHLRKPGFNNNAMSGYLDKIASKYHTRIVIHSCYELINDFNLRGLHITGANIEDKKRVIGQYKSREGLSVSASYHELKDLNNYNPGIDYVFLSPLFDSISKKNYTAQFNHAELKDALKKTKMDVIALGGLKLENVHKVKELGFKGMAFLGAVWDTTDPVKSYLVIQDKVKNI
jgi:thiamine-phosphate pyrophosphorylase